MTIYPHGIPKLNKMSINIKIISYGKEFANGLNDKSTNKSRLNKFTKKKLGWHIIN